MRSLGIGLLITVLAGWPSWAAEPATEEVPHAAGAAFVAPVPDSPDSRPVSPVALQWEWIYPYFSPSDQPRNLWIDAEYVLWRGKHARLPPLVTGGPSGSLGILGQPETVILAGAADVDHNDRSGGRFAAGVWLDYDQALGLEGGYLFAGEKTVHLPTGSNVRPLTPILARPFDDVRVGLPSSSLVLYPGYRTLFVDIAYSTWFQGAECSLLINSWHGAGCRLDWVVGFRFLELQEEVRLLESGKFDRLAPQFGAARLYVEDEFETRNRLVGAHAGMQFKLNQGGWFAAVTGRVAFGGLEQQISVQGLTIVDSPTELPEAYQGGLLALPSNLGVRDRWKFAAVPELTARVGFTFRHWCTLYAGYTLLYWSDVLRAGDQIDTGINPAQLPLGPAPQDGPNRPQPLFRKSSFWIHGISLGCEIRF